MGLFAYLVGGVPVGWLLVRRRRYGLDVRHFGSGNVGASNVYRHAGFGLAAVVGPAQFAQGLVPVLVTDILGLPTEAQVLAGLCAVIGNGWPVYLGFNGGRGVAVATGAVAGLSLAGLGVLLACYAAGALSRQMAAGVITGFTLLPLSMALAGRPTLALGSLGLLILVVLRRLEGVVDDARLYGASWHLLTRRLIRDQRPGRPLEGPRTDGRPV